MSLSASNTVQDGEIDQIISPHGWQDKNIVKYREIYEERLVAKPIITASGKVVSHSLRALQKGEQKKIEWLSDGQVAIAEKCCTPCARINSVRLKDTPPFACFVPANLKFVRLDGSSTCAYCVMTKLGRKCDAQVRGVPPQSVMDNSSQGRSRNVTVASGSLQVLNTDVFATKTDLSNVHEEVNARINEKVNEIERRTGERLRGRSKRMSKIEPPASHSLFGADSCEESTSPEGINSSLAVQTESNK